MGSVTSTIILSSDPAMRSRVAAEAQIALHPGFLDEYAQKYNQLLLSSLGRYEELVYSPLRRDGDVNVALQFYLYRGVAIRVARTKREG